MNQKAKVNQKRKGSRPQGGNQGRSGGGGNRNRRPPRYGKPAPASRRNRTWWIWGGVAAGLPRRRPRCRGRVGRRRRRQADRPRDRRGDRRRHPASAVQRRPEVDTAIGDPIPTLTGVSFDGSKVTIGPTGKPQVVMFLAHWCPHCQAEVPRIVDLAKQGAFKGIDVAAVATGTSAEAPNYPPSAWLEREKWPFPVMVDSLEWHRGAGVRAAPRTPTSCSSTPREAVVGRASGEIAPSDLQKILNALEAGNPLPKGSGAARRAPDHNTQPASTDARYTTRIDAGSLSSRAFLADADEVDAVALGVEAGGAGDGGGGGGHRTLEPG